MGAAQDKNQVFCDYATFLKALLPQAVGFLCYDRLGRLFWQEHSDSAIELTLEYQDNLAALLESPEQSAELGRIELNGAVAYIAPMVGDRGQLLGVWTVLVEPGAAASMTYEFCSSVIKPALRSLQRELALRFQMLEGYRKLSIQASEENLLHQVETLTTDRQDCGVTLEKILDLCVQHMQVDCAALAVPARNIRIVAGETAKTEEIGAVLDGLADQPDFTVQSDSGDIFDASADQDSLTIRLRNVSKQEIGALVLSGWSRSTYSDARRRRVLQFITSHIHSVLDLNFDSLTGLMSWSVFESHLIDACGGKTSGSHTVIYIDVDQLHVTNDTFGRESGDIVLAEVAALMRHHLDGHFLTRIAGDSYAALLLNTDMDKAAVLAGNICRECKEIEHVRDGRSCRPSASIGIGPLSGDPETGSAALSMAQVACQAAKDRGRGRVEIYQSADASIIQRFDDIHLVGQISGAIDNDQLLLLGQPIVPLKSGDTTQYFEILVRLIDDEGGQISPAEFFSAAERYQLMEELDRWVVSNTLESIAGCKKLSKDSAVKFAINLSGQSLGSEAFLSFVQEQISSSGVAPEMLCFEITETVAVANIQRAQTLMRTLQKMGCQFSLDDFGTGLSSFGYLKLFPVNTLKIDGSFIKDISSNVVSQSVVAAISEVARVMELETVAEYVEDEEALSLLKKLGVTWAQGYLMGVPEPFADQLDSIVTASDAAPHVEQISVDLESEEQAAQS
jgi:diguanylate cyclase (GGDEF)-like protein